MVQLDCDDLKRGLATKANRFADQLLQRLAEEHRDENKRCSDLNFLNSVIIKFNSLIQQYLATIHPLGQVHVILV